MPSRRVRHGAARAADSFYHHLRRPFVGTRLDTEGMATRPRTSSATLTTSIAACASAELRVASPNEPAVAPRATDSWQGAGFWSRTPKEEYPCESDRFGKRSPRKHGQRPSRRRLRLRRGPLPHHRATRRLCARDDAGSRCPKYRLPPTGLLPGAMSERVPDPPTKTQDADSHRDAVCVYAKHRVGRGCGRNWALGVALSRSTPCGGSRTTRAPGLSRRRFGLRITPIAM